MSSQRLGARSKFKLENRWDYLKVALVTIILAVAPVATAVWQVKHNATSILGIGISIVAVIIPLYFLFQFFIGYKFDNPSENSTRVSANTNRLYGKNILNDLDSKTKLISRIIMAVVTIVAIVGAILVGNKITEFDTKCDKYDAEIIDYINYVTTEEYLDENRGEIVSSETTKCKITFQYTAEGEVRTLTQEFTNVNLSGKETLTIYLKDDSVVATQYYIQGLNIAKIVLIALSVMTAILTLTACQYIMIAGVIFIASAFMALSVYMFGLNTLLYWSPCGLIVYIAIAGVAIMLFAIYANIRRVLHKFAGKDPDDITMDDVA